MYVQNYTRLSIENVTYRHTMCTLAGVNLESAKQEKKIIGQIRIVQNSENHAVNFFLINSKQHSRRFN